MIAGADNVVEKTGGVGDDGDDGGDDEVLVVGVGVARVGTR